MQAKNNFVRITETFRYVKYIEKYITESSITIMNIIKVIMNNVIILLLAVRICEDSDKRGSDKRGYSYCTRKMVPMKGRASSLLEIIFYVR